MQNKIGAVFVSAAGITLLSRNLSIKLLNKFYFILYK